MIFLKPDSFKTFQLGLQSAVDAGTHWSSTLELSTIFSMAQSDHPVYGIMTHRAEPTYCKEFPSTNLNSLSSVLFLKNVLHHYNLLLATHSHPLGKMQTDREVRIIHNRLRSSFHVPPGLGAYMHELNLRIKTSHQQLRNY